MSSFKRRGATATAILPAGVRACSFSSPVPLVSTGVPALDDLLSGGGLSCGSLLTIIPTTGTATLSAAQIGATATTLSYHAESDHLSRAAAEPYTELLLAYSVAQGIASKHHTVAIGEDIHNFASSLMERAGCIEEKEVPNIKDSAEEEPGPSERLGTLPDDDEEGHPVSAQREREMKIAWRYEKMCQFKTTVQDSAKAKQVQAYCSTFDLSKRISPTILEKAKDDGLLQLYEVDDDGENSFDRAYVEIKKQAERCVQARTDSPCSPSPVLRICLRSLGSPCWRVRRGQCVKMEMVRFLTRLKVLLRSLAIPSTGAAIPAIAVITLSPYILSSCSNVNLVHRVSHIVDAAISISAFAPSAALRTAFPSYTGALKVLRTPALGTLTNPSVRASVLRGMGAGAAEAGSSGEGGAGGGENNLAFKVRRKRLVIETLHLDIEGQVSEGRTKPPKKSSTLQRKAQPATTPQPQVAAAPRPFPQAAAPPTFAGLKSLRERGLAASARPLEVEVDTRKPHTHPHPPKGPVFKSDKMADYEF